MVAEKHKKNYETNGKAINEVGNEKHRRKCTHN
jgi:hypothetical protein